MVTSIPFRSHKPAVHVSSPRSRYMPVHKHITWSDPTNPSFSALRYDSSCTGGVTVTQYLYFAPQHGSWIYVDSLPTWTYMIADKRYQNALDDGICINGLRYPLSSSSKCVSSSRKMSYAASMKIWKWYFTSVLYVRGRKPERALTGESGMNPLMSPQGITTTVLLATAYPQSRNLGAM